MRGVEQINTVLLAGSGIMGASLAQIFARHGYEVILYDIKQQALEQAFSLIETNQKALVQAERVSQDESRLLRERISATDNKDCFGKADFVLEAIVENMSVKQKFWEEISNMVGDDVVLTSNTSGLSITEIAKSVKLPRRFAGMHWVNPPHLIPLVEVIAGDQSDAEALRIVSLLAESVKRKPVSVLKDAPGFILNRLQYALLREAMHIVENGYASCEDVDNVMKYGLGLRYACIGPFETVDFGGVDIFNNVGSYLMAELCDAHELSPLLRNIYKNGDYGVKTGRGFYDYSGDKAKQALEKRDAAFVKVTEALLGGEF